MAELALVPVELGQSAFLTEVLAAGLAIKEAGGFDAAVSARQVLDLADGFEAVRLGAFVAAAHLQVLPRRLRHIRASEQVLLPVLPEHRELALLAVGAPQVYFFLGFWAQCPVAFRAPFRAGVVDLLPVGGAVLAESGLALRALVQIGEILRADHAVVLLLVDVFLVYYVWRVVQIQLRVSQFAHFYYIQLLRKIQL